MKVQGGDTVKLKDGRVGFVQLAKDKINKALVSVNEFNLGDTLDDVEDKENDMIIVEYANIVEIIK
ncbi:MAG: hypothetical protein LBQ05_01245 [Christensenellaceae bacterium]|jgi:hypothetical protein|nr:hypothetical protein [Christensenellaceae bacterium]